MFDFSKTLVRASAVYAIMVNGTKGGKTPMEKYEEALKNVAEEEAKYEALDEKKKAQIPAQKKLAKIASMYEYLDELFKHKDDDPELSPGCKTYLTRLYAAEKYGKWSLFRDRGNRFTQKGHLVEEEAITMLSRIDRRLYVKNDIRIENDFISGVPDILIGDSHETINRVVDIKCPYDAESFFGVLSKGLIAQYQWQLQAYMWLVGAKEGEVAFCLMNTPEYILNNERRRLLDRMESVTEEDPEFKMAEKELINNLTYDDIPIEERVIRFPVVFDESVPDKVSKRVEKCREWLFEIEKMHLSPAELQKLTVEESEGVEENTYTT